MANPIKAVKAIGRAVGGITGKGSKKVNPIYRNETNKIQKNSVKVKPAAKQKPNKPNEKKAMYKFDDSRGRAYNKAVKEYADEFGGRGDKYEAQAIGQKAASQANINRKARIAIKKITKAEKRKATTPILKSTNYDPWTRQIKINSSIPKRGK